MRYGRISYRLQKLESAGEKDWIRECSMVCTSDVDEKIEEVRAKETSGGSCSPAGRTGRSQG